MIINSLDRFASLDMDRNTLWCVKGLQRNGILANREMESNIWIETGDLKTTAIIHETSGGTYITQTIEELLAYFDTEKS